MTCINPDTQMDRQTPYFSAWDLKCPFDLFLSLWFEILICLRLRPQANWVPYVKDLVKVACCAKLLQACPTICDLMDCILPGCSFHGALQARKLGGLLFPPPGHLPNPGIKPTFATVAGRFCTISVIWDALVKVNFKLFSRLAVSTG